MNQWYFKKNDFDLTPSRKANVTDDMENTLRAKGVKFIQDVCFDLKLPQITIATASTYLHRFYMRKSLTEYHHYDIAGTCVFEACKTEETTRKMEDVAKICAKKAQKNPDLDDPTETRKWKHIIAKNEIILLESLMFDLHIEHPYRHLVKYTKEFKNDKNVDREGAKQLAQAAWAMVNDSLRINLCLRHRPNVIASAAIYIAAKLTNFRLNDDPNAGKVWWSIANADIHDIADAVDLMLDNYYLRPKVKNRRVEKGCKCLEDLLLHFECTEIYNRGPRPRTENDNIIHTHASQNLSSSKSPYTNIPSQQNGSYPTPLPSSRPPIDNYTFPPSQTQSQSQFNYNSDFPSSREQTFFQSNPPSYSFQFPSVVPPRPSSRTQHSESHTVTAKGANTWPSPEAYQQPLPNKVNYQESSNGTLPGDNISGYDDEIEEGEITDEEHGKSNCLINNQKSINEEFWNVRGMAGGKKRSFDSSNLSNEVEQNGAESPKKKVKIVGHLFIYYS